MNLVAKGYHILNEDGPFTLARRTAEFVVGQLYWKTRDSYRLSVEGTEVEFSAPHYRTVGRNKGRFASEQETLADLMRELDPDDVFYDIGANTGLYTLFCAERCSKVVAFEPYAPNLALLKRDVLRNGLDNVRVCDVALSDSNGSVTFSQPDEAAVGYGSPSIVGDETSETEEVTTRTGDALIAEADLPTPNVVKIDVEGSEPLVVDGLQDALSDPACRLVYCEVHLDDTNHHPSISDFDVELSDIKRRFRTFGFDVQEVDRRDCELFLKCQK